MYDKIVQLKFVAADGKYYATDCANPETMFRIIQSIPSPKVEPLKEWWTSTSCGRRFQPVWWRGHRSDIP